ncbi:hypothetical protein BH23ACT10_BH23ACT10_26670 [soil metagenome]
MVVDVGAVCIWDVVYHFPASQAEEQITQWCATGSDDVGGA